MADWIAGVTIPIAAAAALWIAAHAWKRVGLPFLAFRRSIPRIKLFAEIDALHPGCLILRVHIDNRESVPIKISRIEVARPRRTEIGFPVATAPIVLGDFGRSLRAIPAPTQTFGDALRPAWTIPAGAQGSAELVTRHVRPTPPRRVTLRLFIESASEALGPSVTVTAKLPKTRAGAVQVYLNPLHRLDQVPESHH